MSISRKDLVPGDVMCCGGQIGEFRNMARGQKKVVVRPYGCDYTREVRPSPASMGRLAAEVRVERNERWVEVE